MSKNSPIKKDESLAHINNDDDVQLGQLPVKNKMSTKLQANKHFSCLHVYENTVYLGTRNSKLYIYKITLQDNKNSSEEFNLSSQKMITPHCEVVSLVKANDKYFVTVPESDQDSFISIWQTKNKMFLTALKGHKSQVSQIIFMKNNKYLVSASWDCTVRLWSLDNLQRDQSVKTFTGNYPILEIRQLNDQVLVFGGDDCYLVFWNWKRQEVIKKQFGHAGSVTYIQILGSSVITAGGDNKFKLWEVSDNQKEQILSADIDFKAKYSIKKVQQQKQQYDSIIFGTFVGDDLLLMDRQGEMFLFTKDKTLNRLSNHFEYNENITGIDLFGQNLLVTTTKGCLKHFNIKEEKQKFNLQLEEDKKQQPQSNLMKIDPSSDE